MNALADIHHTDGSNPAQCYLQSHTSRLSPPPNVPHKAKCTSLNSYLVFLLLFGGSFLFSCSLSSFGASTRQYHHQQEQQWSALFRSKFQQHPVNIYSTCTSELSMPFEHIIYNFFTTSYKLLCVMKIGLWCKSCMGMVENLFVLCVMRSHEISMWRRAWWWW